MFFKNKLVLLYIMLGLIVTSDMAWGLTYEVQINGEFSENVRSTLHELSDSIGEVHRPPASIVHLRRRVERDQERFLRYFHSRGYYGANVDYYFDSDAEPILVNFTITPSPAYILRDVIVNPVTVADAQESARLLESVEDTILTDDDDLSDDFILDDIEAIPLDEVAFPLAMPGTTYLGLHLDRPFIAADIRQAQNRLLRYFRENGYPFPVVTNRQVLVDHAIQSVSVTFEVAPGESARFGELQILGLEEVREQTVRIRLPWEEGDRFDQREMEIYQRRLYDSNLFSTVRLRTSVDENFADVPVTLELVERKHRTVAAGLTYRTDEGAGTQFRWEHRNYRGRGHRLGVESNISQLLTNIKLQYDIDYFRQEGQKIGVDFEIARENTDAYDANRLATNTWLQRELTEHMTVGIGLGLRSSNIEQRNIKKTYHLFSIPTMAAWDYSDDRLNPTHGFRLTLRLTPYADLRGNDAPFLKSEIVGTHYLPFDDDARWILATRLRVGAIGAGSFNDVPPDIRFYAGGGGSIRGFAYQTASPLDNRDPIGGRSVIEANIEIRRQLSDSMGMVMFIDAGSAQEAIYPDFSTTPRYAAGVGVRYFSPLGPLRFDFAVPINKRTGVDSSFQMYISIGQAF